MPDRAAFDREYGAAALLGEREVLSQIPEDRVCDFPAKPRAGSITGVTAKVPTGLCRQTSGTAAALEEVSKCVREMHSFTNELLSWDLVERNGGNGITSGNGDTGSSGDAGGSGTTGVEADSSGDSDDTVIEEAPVEDLPGGTLPRHRATAGGTGITVAPPPPPLPETPPPPCCPGLGGGAADPAGAAGIGGAPPGYPKSPQGPGRTPPGDPAPPLPGR